jgi:hypothetical protein
MTPPEPDSPALNGHVTHGDSLLKKAIKVLGSRAIDGRSVLAKELKQECRDLVSEGFEPSVQLPRYRDRIPRILP